MTRELDESRAAVAVLARRYGLPSRVAEQLEQFAAVLAGDPYAPTAVRQPAQVVDDHLADALVALEVVQLRAASAIVDVGSGAGVPGLALAISLSEAEVFLVESVGRKCEFLARAVAVCGVTNAHIVNERVEAWDWGLGRFDVVTARAVAAPAVVAEYAAPLLRIGGALVLWRGQRDPAAEAAAERAAAQLGLDRSEPVAVAPYPGAKHRNLQLMFKVRQTPSGFPRRPGIAAKRPLGGRSASASPASDRNRQ